MRRSVQVAAPILASLAAALLTGCKTQDVQHCVDEQNHVVDPKFCAALPAGSTQPVAGDMRNGGGSWGNNGNFIPHYFRYYYGGAYGGGFNTPIVGGGYAPVAGHAYSLGGTSRGGFGGSFGHGGGAGE